MTFFSNHVQQARGSNPGVARGAGRTSGESSSESLSETMMKSKFPDDRCRRWQQLELNGNISYMQTFINIYIYIGHHNLKAFKFEVVQFDYVQFDYVGANFAYLKFVVVHLLVQILSERSLRVPESPNPESPNPRKVGSLLARSCSRHHPRLDENFNYSHQSHEESN